MSKTLRKIDIFVSSPSDVQAERQAIVQIIQEFNVLPHVKANLKLEAYAYEVEAPGIVGDTPAKVVDRYMMSAGSADIFVCVLWSRMGTPVLDHDTGIEYVSGTYYEFSKAYEHFQFTGSPIILLYRCVRPIAVSADLRQAAKVQEFFEQFEGPDARFLGLHKAYTSIDDLVQKFRRDLDQVLLDFQVQSGARNNETVHEVGFQTHLSRYLDMQVQRHRHITLRFNTLVTADTLPIEEVIVFPQITAPDRLPARLVERPLPYESQSLCWDDLLTQTSHLLLVGDAGVGKSTLSQWLCFKLATNSLDGKNLRIPFFVPLLELELYLKRSDSTHKPLALIDYLEHQVASTGKAAFPVGFVGNLLERFPACIVFDGLDEIASVDVQAYVLSLIHKLALDYPMTQTVIALRPTAYRADMLGGDYRYSILLPLGIDAQIELLHKVGCALHHINPQYVKESSLDEFRRHLRNPALTGRLAKPLFLVAAYLYSLALDSPLVDGAHLIHRRLLELILYDWESIKLRTAQMHMGELPTSMLDNEHPSYMDMLSFLGFRSLERDRGSVTLDEAAEWLSSMNDSLGHLVARQTIASQAKRVAERTEILSISHRKITFTSNADAMLFAANYDISSTKLWDTLVAYRTDEAWREVINTAFDFMLLDDVTTATEFLAFLLRHAEMQNEQVHASEFVLLAAECTLRSTIDLATKGAVVQHILDILGDRQQGTPLATRIALGRALGTLGDPRIGQRMILIPRGEFFMGYDMFPEDRPARRVIADDFYIDPFPVTNQQFALFIADGGYSKRALWSDVGWAWVRQTERQRPKFWSNPDFSHPNYPVVGVTWHEASAYAKWAGKRLPTETEWEKAARGAERSLSTGRLIGPSWAWGNDFRSDFLNCAESKDLDGKPVGATTPVGIYPAGVSPYGVHDMCGNVSEWTSDWYKAYDNNAHVDTHFGAVYKVRRGGGWAADQDFVRCTCRVGSLPHMDFAIIGFRCCVDLHR